jgi:uncharacterized NAD(P)/FAD-binding protein YdhS
MSERPTGSRTLLDEPTPISTIIPITGRRTMHTLDGPLLELVQKLDGLGAEPSLVALAKTLKEARLQPADVAGFIRSNARTYNRAHVVIRDAYELLVMTWLPGQASVPHDHSGSTCAMHVVQGELKEGCYRIAADGYVDLEFEAAVPGGEVTAGQDAGVHTVRNAGDAVAVSVHIYSPPLKEFRQFKHRPQTAAAASVTTSASATIVIVGGGFSGSMTAAQILRLAGAANWRARVVIAEQRGVVGEGIAYGTREPVHLLNVPAGRMSAWPDRPDDFLAWARRRDNAVAATDFLPRMWYGDYVRDALLSTARDVHPLAELTVTFDEVRNVSRHPVRGWMVHFARQPSLQAGAVILAVGHRPPSDPLGSCWSGPRTRFLANPWRPFATNVIGADEPVVLIGSGLTAVDSILSIAQEPRQAPIIAVSRNGLVPHAHAKTPVHPTDLRNWVTEQINRAGGMQARLLLSGLRQMARECGEWRSVLDGLRPFTAQIWQALPLSERRRFLTRLRAYWEIHRHRMATAVADRIAELLANGNLRLIAGRIDSAKGEAEGVRLTIRERGAGRLRELTCGWVINCTGPVTPNSAESNPVVGSLLVGGWLQPDPLSLGVETSAAGNAIGENGQPVPDLFVVGTLRKPALWESTAVPELRQQAASAANNVVAWLARHASIADGL